jgi:hypothetical protein
VSEKYKVKVQGDLYFITVTVVDWVDLVIRPVYKDIIIDAIKYCQKTKGLKVWAYVIIAIGMLLSVLRIPSWKIS